VPLINVGRDRFSLHNWILIIFFLSVYLVVRTNLQNTHRLAAVCMSICQQVLADNANRRTSWTRLVVASNQFRDIFIDPRTPDAHAFEYIVVWDTSDY
jgi:hypothetical protein